jgi:vacuolar-type H+-ATPase subunit I/STV1
MPDTIVLAKVIGIFALLEGFSMLLRRKMLLSIFHEMARSRILSYIVGLIMIILGLLIAVRHTIFDGVLSSVVTLIGWFITIEGTVYLFLSQKIMERYIRTLDRPLCYYTVGVGYLILGVYLCVAAFS